MLRLLSFLVALALVAFGLMWLADNPGEVALTWRGTEYDVSLMFALGIVIALALALGVVWSILRFVFRIPSLLSLAHIDMQAAKNDFLKYSLPGVHSVMSPSRM